MPRASPHAASSQSVTVQAGPHEVRVSSPGKLMFPQAGVTKLDLVNYYLSVAEGALRGAGNRPCVMKRYPDGVDGEAFFQKRAPANRPDWVCATTLHFPSGRTAEEVVPCNAATLAWMANLNCIELHPHPVRIDDLDHPDELRIDLDPTPGVPWSQIVEVAAVVREVLDAVGLVGFPKTSGSRGVHVLREVERRVPKLATSAWWKEERHGVFIDYNQNAKDRTVASAYSVRPRPDARVSAPVGWDELRECDPADFTVRTMPQRYARLGDLHAAIDERACSLEALLELSARQAATGQGDAPWPPHYRKQEGEPPRAPPSVRKPGRRVTKERAAASKEKPAR